MDIQQYCINTNFGQLDVSTLQNLQILSHEYLAHQVSQNQANQLTLKTIKNHLQNPYNLINTSITLTLIQHQLQYISNSLAIVDASEKQLLQEISKIIIFKCFKHNIKKTLSMNEQKVYYSLENCKKNLDLQFKFGTIKPALIGQITISILNFEDEFQKNALISYFQFSKSTNCPIIFNCVNSKNSQCIFQKESTQINNIYIKIDKIIELAKNKGTLLSKIIIFNPPVVFHTSQKTNQIIKTHKTIQKVLKIRSNKINIGYDLLRYNDHDFLHFLAKEIIEYKDSTILSAGVLYKTDMNDFGGQGFQCKNLKNKLKQKMNEITLNQVFYKNILKLLIWKKKQKKIVEIVYWKCQECKKDFEQSVQKFKKFGKEFCSVPCIRKHKF